MKKFFTICMLILSILTTHATVHTVLVDNFSYTPATLSISLGDTVRFEWVAGSHPTASDSSVWTTFAIDATNTSYDLVLTAVGSYPYYCTFHGSAGGVGMAGSITVNAVSNPPIINLNPGSLAFIGFQSDTPDSYAFVALDDVPGGTPIIFTDRSYGISTTNTNPNAFYSTSEDTMVYYAPAAGLAKGTVILLSDSAGTSLVLRGSGTTSGSLFGISVSGDNIFALQGSMDNPSFIAGILSPRTIDSTWLVSPALAASTASYLPSSLTNGLNAVSISKINVDNGYYNGPTTGDVASLLANINNPANWINNDDPVVGGINIWPNWSFNIITPVNNFPGIPAYNIGTINTVDSFGVLDSVNVVCQITGTVLGIDMRGGNGYQFTIVDSTGGIGVFTSVDLNPNYIVSEGDYINLRGTVAQFNGLAQINVDSIVFLAQGFTLPTPAVVTSLGEFTESQLVRMNNMSLVTPSQWPAAGSSASVTITDGTNNFVLRIDNDTDIDGSTAPTGNFDVIGIGGQFDSSSPFTSGYQLLPRYFLDIIVNTPTFPTIEFQNTTATVLEDTAVFTSILDIIPPTTQADTVTILVTKGPGITAGDYSTTPSSANDTITLFLPINTAAIAFDLNVVDDTIPESTENLHFHILSTSSGLVMGSNMAQSVDIIDNDSVPPAPIVPTYLIDDLTTIDANGVADSVGVYCKITGVVMGLNIGTLPQMIFTVGDVTGGIGVFSSTGLPYTVTEGDLIRVIGTVAQFNGLTQINADSIVLISQGNQPPAPFTTLTLGENTESEYVRMQLVELATPAQWPGLGLNANVDITDLSGNTFVLRVDKDANLDGTIAPEGKFTVVGIGGQFDSSSPFTSGYQILPHFTNHIITANHSLLLPTNGVVYTNNGLPNSTTTIEWNSTPALGGGSVSYEFLLDVPSGDFSNPVFSAPSDNAGADTTFTISKNALNSLLVLNGVALDDTLSVKWTVRASNNYFNKLAAPFNINIVRGLITSVDEVLNDLNYSVYPNPTKGLVQIVFNSLNTQPYEVEIYSVDGRKVYGTKLYGNATLDLNNLSEGVYQLKMIQNQTVDTKKLVLIK